MKLQEGSENNSKLLLEPLEHDFSVRKVSDYSKVDLTVHFTFTGATDEEISLVCPSVFVPDNTLEREDGFRGFRLAGVQTVGSHAVKDQIRCMYKEKRQTLILIIDEAQYLNTSILTDLKMLMNFDCDTVNCFALILCGEPYLTSALNNSPHMQNRIIMKNGSAVQIRISCMNTLQTLKYVCKLSLIQNKQQEGYNYGYGLCFNV